VTGVVRQKVVMRCVSAGVGVVALRTWVATLPKTALVTRSASSWGVACEEVDEEYIPMFVEEMNLYGDDPRRIDLDDVDQDRKQALSALIIGCGEGGLLAGLRLKQAGIPFTILDKNPGVGGTWLDNSYPGCPVDVGNHFYCYSFEPNDSFSEFFCRQPELLAYFRSVMSRWDIEPHVQWNTEVVSAVWDEAASRWQVGAKGPGGADINLTADIVISAVGQLNRPKIPDFPGLDSFRGPVFHTARWDHSVDLAGKRVAMIGAGASGFQVGPTIAPDVDRLFIFQRSPQWMAPNPKYRLPVGEGVKWAMRHLLSGYAAWYRFMLLYQASDKSLKVVQVDSTWPGLPDSSKPLSEERRQMLVAWIEKHIGDDPELLAKVVPHYPPMATRMLQDDGSWLKCLRRDNVDLVTDEILRIDSDAVVTAMDATRWMSS
jgi:4-hydroxyacetophenone monooxygenase